MKAVSSYRSVALAIALAGWASLACATQRYRIEAICPVPKEEELGSVESVGGLNYLGEVAFTYRRLVAVSPNSYSRVSEAYVSTSGGIVSIPDLGGQSIRATDLTDNGRVVGGAYSSDTYQSIIGQSRYYEPFVNDGAQTTAIATPTRGHASAVAANNSGDIIGYLSPTLGYDATVFKWNSTNGYQNLGNFGAYADPKDINNRGDILVNLTSGEILQHGSAYLYHATNAFIFSNGLMTQVPDSPYRLTKGAAINDTGAVVGGFATVPGSEGHAYIWDDRNGFRDLAIDDENSFARDINNANVVVGSYTAAYAEPATAFVYNEQDGRHSLIDLIDNDDGWSRLESADRINDRGQIAGIGYGPGGRRIYLATPIPEPSTVVACMVLSIFALMTPRHRARR